MALLLLLLLLLLSGVCFVSKQLASTSFRRQVLSTLLVQRWRSSSGNVRLSSLLISSCYCSVSDLYIHVSSMMPSNHVCRFGRDQRVTLGQA